MIYYFLLSFRILANGAPGKAGGFSGEKEEGGSRAQFSPQAETERRELLPTRRHALLYMVLREHKFYCPEGYESASLFVRATRIFKAKSGKLS